jgi:hypothetical protein
VAVVTTDSIVQTAFVVVLLRYMQTALPHRALDGRVFAVQHDMVVDVDAVIDPIAACLAIRALDNKLVQHVLDDLGHWAEISSGLDLEPTCRACLAAARLRGPGVLEAVVAEVVLAGQLDGLVKGCVADEADEVAVGRRHVLEGRELGRGFDDAAAASLRRG